MKPITLENLRRLVGAGRKKKERAESSFKRSDSFKRISIRKNYLERGGGGKGRNPKPPPPPTSTAESDKATDKLPAEAESLVIGYGQWIKCMRAEDYEHLKELSRGEKNGESPPTPPPRKKLPGISTTASGSVDSSLEILRLDTSPVPARRRFRRTPPPPREDRSDSGLSISFGRVWMDAPLAMANAPRSLELPRPTVESDPAGRRAHHSLESALKEKFGSRRFHMEQANRRPPVVCRTLSSTTQTTSTSKTVSSRSSTEVLSSSKDSGFSFSVSIPRLSDLSPTGSGGGFFCKKKQSSSREHYFKRSQDSFKRSSGRSNKKGRKKSTGSVSGNSATSGKSDMYQVIVSRPPRCLKSLKLDPMIFVPPEKRKPSSNTGVRRNPFPVQEIRDYCSPRDVKVPSDDEEDEGLYECISGEFNTGESDTEDIPPRRSLIKFKEAATSDNDADTEDDGAYAPVTTEDAERRPVRRRKSNRKGVKYVARPSIHRAPSTLKRNKKLLKKQGRWPHVAQY